MKEYVKFKLGVTLPGIPSRPTCRSCRRLNSIHGLCLAGEEQGWNPQEVGKSFPEVSGKKYGLSGGPPAKASAFAGALPHLVGMLPIP